MENNNHQLEEIIAIRKELEHLQDRNLVNIWEQIKELNKQNSALIEEVHLLKKSLTSKVALGTILGSIVFGILVGFIISLSSPM